MTPLEKAHQKIADIWEVELKERKMIHHSEMIQMIFTILDEYVEEKLNEGDRL